VERKPKQESGPAEMGARWHMQLYILWSRALKVRRWALFYFRHMQLYILWSRALKVRRWVLLIDQGALIFMVHAGTCSCTSYGRARCKLGGGQGALFLCSMDVCHDNVEPCCAAVHSMVAHAESQEVGSTYSSGCINSCAQWMYAMIMLSLVVHTQKHKNAHAALTYTHANARARTQTRARVRGLTHTCTHTRTHHNTHIQV
jgi:hypothetical protein